MSRRLVVVFILLFFGAAALLAGRFGFYELPFDLSGKDASQDAPKTGEHAPSGSASEKPREIVKSGTTLDIARISPDGSSVFAGRAEPDAYITVLEGGRPVASGKADSNGEWSLVTEHRFASLEPDLAINAGAAPTRAQAADASPPPAAQPGPAETTRETPAAQAAAPAASPVPAPSTATSPAGSASAKAVAAELMGKFEKLVAEAREEAKAEKEAQPATPGVSAAPDTKPETQEPPAKSDSPSAAEAKAGAATPPANSGAAVAAQPPTAKPDTSAPASPLAKADAPVTAQPPTAKPDTSAPAASATSPSATTAAEATAPPSSPQSAPTLAEVIKPQPPASTPPQTADEVPASAPSAPATALQGVAAASARTSVTIPVPIMFVYNEATFTSEGRRAIELLLEYLKLKHLDSIALSGHADERGSGPYNMDLSRERLEIVEHRLREGGFTGKLDLIPKGETEPFTGVDRARYTGEALYQLDRRVELRTMQ